MLTHLFTLFSGDFLFTGLVFRGLELTKSEAFTSFSLDFGGTASSFLLLGLVAFFGSSLGFFTSSSSESESDEQASGAEGSDVEDINDAGVAEEGDVASLSVLKENENVEGNVSRNYKERGAAEVGSEQCM